MLAEATADIKGACLAMLAITCAASAAHKLAPAQNCIMTWWHAEHVIASAAGHALWALHISLH